MPFNDCDHVDKVLAFSVNREKIEQVVAAMMKKGRREGERVFKNEGTLNRWRQRYRDQELFSTINGLL